jgi:hypothetical protein
VKSAVVEELVVKETAPAPAPARAAATRTRPRRTPRRKVAWTEDHVRRLFWRAGFGARPDEAAAWAKRGRDATLRWILDGRPGEPMRGPAPIIEGKALDPYNEWGHNTLWWLDRMVRSRRPLVEKMTLFWHDHFAVTDQDTPLMMRQNALFRRRALGSFPKLLRDITVDPAMLMFLSLADSDKESPNENYARELMELFTLGKGYSETDIRQAARAMTGFKSKWTDDGFQGISYDAERHDGGVKKIFGKRGRFTWKDVLDLVLAHRSHPPYLVNKLWSYFVTDPPSRATTRDLAAIYKRSGMKIKPVVAAILGHPALYRNLGAPDMVKSPVVYVAGSLRTAGLPLTMNSPTWMLESMGQRPFDPPSVAGWEWGPAWMSSNSMRVRFDWGNQLLREELLGVKKGQVQPAPTPADALEQALNAVGRPWISNASRAHLLDMAAHFYDDITPRNLPRRGPERAEMLQQALRLVALAGPDAQLH